MSYDAKQSGRCLAPSVAKERQTQAAPYNAGPMARLGRSRSFFRHAVLLLERRDAGRCRLDRSGSGTTTNLASSKSVSSTTDRWVAKPAVAMLDNALASNCASSGRAQGEAEKGGRFPGARNTSAAAPSRPRLGLYSAYWSCGRQRSGRPQLSGTFSSTGPHMSREKSARPRADPIVLR